MTKQNGSTTQLAQASDPHVTQPAEEGPEHEARPHEHPLKKLHRLLRGRYWLAIALGGILAVAGAVGGWFAVTPMYAARGQVAVKTYVPPIMYNNAQTGRLPRAQNFIAAQAQLIDSPRVRNNAMESETWNDFSQGMGVDAKQQFDERLTVNQPRNTNVINVRYSHPNRKAAVAAVKSVIGAYREIFRDRETRQERRRFQILEDKRSSLTGQISSLNERVRQVAGAYGPETLQQRYQFKLEEVQQIKKELRSTEVALASTGVSMDQLEQNEAGGTNANTNGSSNANAGANSNSNLGAGSSGQQAGAAAAAGQSSRWQTLTNRQLGRFNRQLQQMLNQKRALQRSFNNASQTFGENHRRVRELRNQLRSLEDSIEQYASRMRKAGPSAIGGGQAAGTGGGGASAGGSVQQMSVSQLKAKRSTLNSLLDQANQRLQALSEKESQVAELKQQRSNLEDQLQQTKTRIERLSTEANALVSGRITVNSNGEPMPEMVNSGSRNQLTAFGFVGGGALGMGLVVLLGLRDRRLQTVADVQQFGQLRMLGMLPNLPRNLADPTNADRAAYAVHHIRSMLQLANHDQKGQTLAITGPNSGAGKTSLTLGLGLSFANSGTRTLLIDCDLGGAGLSHRLQAFIRRRLGRILLREGRIDADELEYALAKAERENKQLGQALLESEVIDEQALADALDVQARQSVGLLDVLQGESLSSCVAETGLDNLSILPVGDADAADTRRLSPKAMQRIVEEARDHYDMVLIDAGPLPGSVESTIAAGVADQAVLILSRGDQQADARRSLGVLHSVNVPLAGVVFNRAEERDLERSTPSRRSLISRGQPEDSGTRPGHRSPDEAQRLRTNRFDPLSRVIASVDETEVADEANEPGVDEDLGGDHERSAGNGHKTRRSRNGKNAPKA